MEETPRTDKIVADWLGGKISAVEMRRQFQGMERDLIRAQAKFAERVNDDKKYLVDPICCLEMGLEDCQAELVEARAEIGRLTLLAQNQQTIIDAQRSAAKTKDALIKQMREWIIGACQGCSYVNTSRCDACRAAKLLEATEGSG